jgi:GAF domain-containing protein
MNELPVRASDGTGQTAVLQLSPAACTALYEDLPRACGPDAALRILEQVRQSLLGDGLLTVNLNTTPERASDEAVELQRLWSSNPAAYPVAGRKRKAMTPWTRQLLRRCEVFVGEGDATLAEVFDDHAQIALLGLHAVINVPMLAGGRCVATFNVLGPRPQWQPHEVMLVRLLAVLATPWVLKSAAGTLPTNNQCP